MIGAGFSRTAARHVGSDKRMPLWNAFSEKLLSELNPSGKDAKFSDPLRVAEEYRAYFGQAALNDQIRAQIDDDVRYQAVSLSVQKTASGQNPPIQSETQMTACRLEKNL